jgi:hypothetical protein
MQIAAIQSKPRAGAIAATIRVSAGAVKAVTQEEIVLLVDMPRGYSSEYVRNAPLYYTREHMLDFAYAAIAADRRANGIDTKSDAMARELDLPCLPHAAWRSQPRIGVAAHYSKDQMASFARKCVAADRRSRSRKAALKLAA